MSESNDIDRSISEGTPSIEVSNTQKLKNKRPRAESSEDENASTAIKKHCSSENKELVETHENKENGKTLNEDSQDTKNEGVKVKGENDTDNELDSGINVNDKVSVKQEEKEEKNDIKHKKNGKTEEDTEDVDMEAGDKNGEEKNGKANSDGNNSTTGRDKVKDKKELEVVGGLELSVECASERESSSSESRDEQVVKPRHKTTIVKVDPTDSELEIGSSDGEKSDDESILTSKTSKETVKKGKKGIRQSSIKTKNSSSPESHDSDASDKDSSPRTRTYHKELKNYLEKVATNKKTKEVEESKGSEKEKNNHSDGEEDDSEDNKDKQQTSDEHSDSKNGNASDSDNKSKGKGRNSSTSAGNRKIENLKRYIRAAGIRVKCYQDLFANSKSNSAKVKCLEQLLEKHGVTGRPTLKKCQKAKLRMEKLNDISGLSTSNIISEARITRAQRNLGSTNDSKTSESPTKRGARTSFKRIMNVVDTDSE